jgi:hypothetical protein
VVVPAPAAGPFQVNTVIPGAAGGVVTAAPGADTVGYAAFGTTIITAPGPPGAPNALGPLH